MSYDPKTCIYLTCPHCQQKNALRTYASGKGIMAECVNNQCFSFQITLDKKSQRELTREQAQTYRTGAAS